MILNLLKTIFTNSVSIFNNYTLLFFHFIYKYLKLQTIEDKYHSDKKNSNKLMNKVKFEFNNKTEFNTVKNNVLAMINDDTFLNKYNISSDSILNHDNNKIAVSFTDNCIYIYFNHYYISGPTMFILLNKIVNSTPPKFLETNPYLGIINLPFYIYDLMLLKKKEYLRDNKESVNLIIEKKIKSTNKRFYLYLSILQKVYISLQMNRPMIVALSFAFDELPYINNNVGLIIIQYEITDTIEILEKKIKDASYQVFASNFIINCPLPSFGSIELRDYVDCIVSSMYIKSDYDFKFGWSCSKSPIEQMYVGSVSILRSDGSMDINMVLTTCSSNYKKSYECVENFFIT
jgi:hypothetical protein